MTQLLRYGTVGVSNTVVTLTTFWLLAHLGVRTGAASALAFAAGAVNGYALNRTWTFRAAGGRATFARYVLVQAVGAAGSAVGVTLLAALGRLEAECLVLPAVTLLTFTLARALVFRSRAAPPWATAAPRAAPGTGPPRHPPGPRPGRRRSVHPRAPRPSSPPTARTPRSPARPAPFP